MLARFPSLNPAPYQHNLLTNGYTGTYQEREQLLSIEKAGISDSRH